MNPLLRLYPREWRERYGDEVSRILADRPPSPADVLDLLLGALDARVRALHPTRSEVPVTARLGPSRIGSLAALVAGVLWIITVLLAFGARGGTGGSPTPFVILLMVASASMLVALFGLDVAGDGQRARLRWSSVLLPAAGIVLTVIGGIGIVLVGDRPFIAGYVPWVFWAPGVILLLLGSALFGTTVAINDGSIRWRGVLLEVGALVQLFGLIGTDLANDDIAIGILGAFLFGGGWIALGLTPNRIPRLAGRIPPAVIGGLLVVALQAGAVYAQSPAPGSPAAGSPATIRAADAVLRDEAGAERGTIAWTQADGGVTVNVSVQGLAPGFHGFHVHAMGECVAPFTSAGGHLNPDGSGHGHHVGDMPPLWVKADGSAVASFTTDLDAVADIVGRAVVVHGGPDNLANVPDRYLAPAPSADPSASPVPLVAGPDTATLNTGDSGPRVACGVIEPTP